MTPTINLNEHLQLVVNDGPTLQEYLEQTYGINLLKSENGITIIDLKSKQMWKPNLKVVTEYGEV